MQKKSENFFSERRIKEKLVGQLFSRYAKEKKIFFFCEEKEKQKCLLYAQKKR